MCTFVIYTWCLYTHKHTHTLIILKFLIKTRKWLFKYKPGTWVIRQAIILKKQTGLFMWVMWVWVKVAVHLLWHACGNSQDNLQESFFPSTICAHLGDWIQNIRLGGKYFVLRQPDGTPLPYNCHIFIVYSNGFHKNDLFQVYHIVWDCSVLCVLPFSPLPVPHFTSLYSLNLLSGFTLCIYK